MDLLFFDILATGMIIIDMHNYDDQITPLTIFGGVYIILINLNNLVIHKIYSFVLVNPKAIWSVFYLLFLIFVLDIMGGCIYKKSFHRPASDPIRFHSYRAVTFLFLGGTAAYTLQFFTLYRSYGLNIKGMNDGILGHLTSFAYIMGPVALDRAIQTKRKFKIFIALFLNLIVFVINVCFGGKYVIFINLTYFLLYFVLKRSNRTDLKKLGKIVLTLVVVAVAAFVVLYYIIPRVTGQYQSTLDFAIEHMFYYLLSSVTANNYTMTHAGRGNSLIPFTVLINIGKALAGDKKYVSSIYPFIFPVDNSTFTNVSGFLGETVYDLGIGGASLYVLLIFGTVNYFYCQYRSKNRFYLSFCYSNAIIAFLFFGNFYSVSGIFLPLLLAVFLDAFSLCNIGRYHI